MLRSLRRTAVASASSRGGLRFDSTAIALANPLWIVPLGNTNYDACHALQTRVFNAKAKPIKEARLDGRKRDPSEHMPDVIFVTEHNHPVYTMGRRDTSDGFKSAKYRKKIELASKNPLKGDDVSAVLKELSEEGPSEASVRQIARGGGLTWHGPGQAVVYPIVEFRFYWEIQDKKKRGPSPLHWMVEQLEQAMIDTLCKDCGIQAHAGKVGVWVPSDSAPNGEAKIGFVGLHAAESLTMHGCSLNVNNDLRGFEQIEMCELPERVPTSLQTEQVKQAVEMADTKDIGWVGDRAMRIGHMIADHLTENLLVKSGGPTNVTRFSSPEEGLKAVLNTFRC
jgi:lipoyl(octanoyl) transferase